jgi:hypothetical protein
MSSGRIERLTSAIGPWGTVSPAEQRAAVLRLLGER